MSVLKQIICFFRGHDWKVLRDAGKQHMMNIHPLIGCDADCCRCGSQWRDHDYHIWPWPETTSRDEAP